MNTKPYATRTAALDLLVRIGEQGGYSHLLLDQAMQKNHLNAKDRALLTEIVYGTLQYQFRLQYYLQPFVQKKKIDKWVKWLLYLSVYQMEFLEKVPDHAVFHQSVEISKQRGHKGIANFVNGVLRAIQRKGVPSIQAIEDPIKRLSIATSHPGWLVKRWVDQFGMAITEDMCHTNLQTKPMTIRTQPLKRNRDELLQQLERDGFHVEPSIVSNQGIVVKEGNILHHSVFQNHLCTIQDESSMLVAEMMDIEPNMTILDACSAPGGKATHIAEKLQDRGEVIAYDLHGKKAKLVEQKATELSLQSIHAQQADARKLDEIHEAESFDRILVDAPCSGLGVLRSKPDIKYNKVAEDISTLADIQYEILKKMTRLLKKDGKLIYSTCTVDKEENEWLIARLLQELDDWEVDQSFFEQLPNVLSEGSGISRYGIQMFPQDINSDGFFITRLVRTSG